MSETKSSAEKIYRDLLSFPVIEEVIGIWLDSTSGPVFVVALQDLLRFSSESDDDRAVESERKKVLSEYPWLQSAEILQLPALPFLLSKIRRL